jgi:hypothetical protein
LTEYGCRERREVASERRIQAAAAGGRSSACVLPSRGNHARKSSAKSDGGLDVKRAEGKRVDAPHVLQPDVALDILRELNRVAYTSPSHVRVSHLLARVPGRGVAPEEGEEEERLTRLARVGHEEVW